MQAPGTFFVQDPSALVLRANAPPDSVPSLDERDTDSRIALQQLPTESESSHAGTHDADLDAGRLHLLSLEIALKKSCLLPKSYCTFLREKEVEAVKTRQVNLLDRLSF
jgi:hypothetical protein